MRRLAIFVEGQTEQIFIERLIEVMASPRHVTFERRTITGGRGQKARTSITIRPAADGAQELFVLVVDCGSDEQVKSRIRESYSGLESGGYVSIIGLRDLLPHKREDLPRLQGPIAMKHMPTGKVPITLVLAVMEIEAWFLAEHTHLPRFDSRLTMQAILDRCGFDPSSEHMEDRPNPSCDLNAVYGLAEERWDKTREQVERTVSLLDCNRMCVEMRPKYAQFNSLVGAIDLFLN